MNTRKTVSLFLYLPETKEMILSRRSESRTRPGLLQATAHGELETAEDDQTALARELKEETTLDIKTVRNLKFIKTVEAGQRQPEKCRYYLAEIDQSVFAGLKPTEEVKEFVKVTAKDLENIAPFSSAEMKGIDLFNNNVMYDDELGALKEIFPT